MLKIYTWVHLHTPFCPWGTTNSVCTLVPFTLLLETWYLSSLHVPTTRRPSDSWTNPLTCSRVFRPVGHVILVCVHEVPDPTPSLVPYQVKMSDDSFSSGVWNSGLTFGTKLVKRSVYRRSVYDLFTMEFTTRSAFVKNIFTPHSCQGSQWGS